MISESGSLGGRWIYRSDWYNTLLGQIIDNGVAGFFEWLFYLKKSKNSNRTIYHIRILFLGVGIRKKIQLRGD